MKKAILPLVISLLVICSTIAWFWNSPGKLSLPELGGALIIFVMAALGILVFYRRLQSARQGEPAWDELSRRMMQKASSLAFYGSLYLWLVIMYLNDKMEVETDVLIGSGILGMTLLWLVCTIYVRLKGLNNE